jgi:nicotinamide-nucleotide amidase
MNLVTTETKGLTSLGRVVGALLKERGQTVAVSESAAGGLISACLLSIPGASAYYVGGGVVYTRKARRALLGLSRKEAAQRGATEDYALLAAETVREEMGSTWGLSESGTTGPAINAYGDAPGYACFAISGPLNRVMTFENDEHDRETNMWAFAQAALELLEETVREFSGLLTVYGIPNCDSCRKAMKWLDAQEIEYRFHNFRKDGLGAATLNDWINEFGWENLINRRSTSWKQLPEAMRTNVTPVSASSLIMANPTLVKRPVMEYGEYRWVGFGEAEKQALRDLAP